MASQRHTGHAARARLTVPGPGEVPRHSDAVLDAAYACIIDVGLRRTTVAEVARRAGVSRMTVYRQYGDLDAVVTSLLDEELRRIASDARAVTHGLPTARERVVETAVVAAAGLARHPLLRRVLDLDPEALLPYMVDRLGSSQRAMVSAAEQEIATGLADHSIRAVDPRRAALTVLLTGQSLVFSGKVVEAEDSLDELLDELRVMLDGYLRP